MTRRPDPAVLVGRQVRLEPLSAAHLPGLRDALAHPEVFAGGFGGGPAGLPEAEEFDAWALAYGVADDARRFVVRLVGGEHDGRVVGATTLGDLDEAAGTAHLGWTGYHPRVWGTAVNPETKLLVLGHAFAHGTGASGSRPTTPTTAPARRSSASAPSPPGCGRTTGSGRTAPSRAPPCTG